MLKRSVLIALIAVAVTTFLSCDTATMLLGKLILQTGQTGDVQNCKVQLFVSQDLTGNPVKEVGSEQSGDMTRSPFEFTEVLPGYYYLLAWKDLSGDGTVSDGDIVGIHGGTYRHGYGGSQVTVVDGKTTDVGEIVMMIYKELMITAAGSRSQGGTQTDFTYSFSYDVTLTSLNIIFPGLGTVPDPDAPGAKVAGTTYNSSGWNVGGEQMPTGAHTLNFVGTWDGVAFAVDVIVTVN